MGNCATKPRESKDDAAAAPLPAPPSPTKEASAGAGDVIEVVETGEYEKYEAANYNVDLPQDKSRSLINLFKENEGRGETLNESSTENEENLNFEEEKRIVVVEESEVAEEIIPSMVVETRNLEKEDEREIN